MTAFSFQDYHIILESSYLPNTAIEMPLHQQNFGESITNDSSFLGCYYSLEANPEISAIDARASDSISSLDNGSKAPSFDTYISCSPVQGEPHLDKIPKLQQGSVEKERKNADETSLITGQSKDTMESKSKKSRKRPRTGETLKEKEGRKPEVDGTKASNTCGEPLFIHVRARRGQATDSHSLAERVRREKISERMKKLQSLVPNCDKITGKALILDEIINYVKDLQNQVEFLSMKIASMSRSMSYDFGMDFDDSMNQPEQSTLEEVMRSMAQPMPSIGEANPFQFAASNSGPNNCEVMDPSAPLLLQGLGPTFLYQDESSFMIQVLEQHQQEQRFANPIEFSNMFSFSRESEEPLMLYH